VLPRVSSVGNPVRDTSRFVGARGLPPATGPVARRALAPSPSPRYLGILNHSPLCNGGWPSRAAFFVLDTKEPRHASLESHLAAIVAPTLADMGYELVRVILIGRDNPTVQIMADRADGALITVADCEAITHAVGAVIDVEDPLPGTWTLEVSSAGIDRPLTRVKDWNRFAGHLARAETELPIDGRKRFSGIVLGADATAARLRLDDGTEVALPLAHVRRAKLVLTDALIAATASRPQAN
jgi:ribosome maturation factor RimP